MASVKSIILSEYANKRRKAQLDAQEYKNSVFKLYPELESIDKELALTATEYTKRMLAGEDVALKMQNEISALRQKKSELLKSLSLSEDSFKPRYECNICNDEGIVTNGLCRCFKKRMVEENFKKSNLGSFLEDQSFDSFELEHYPEAVTVNSLTIRPRENMQKTFDACVRFADRFDEAKKSLLFIGSTGLGKTFLSTCIAKELLKKGKSVVYISAVDFFKRIEQGRFDSQNLDIDLFENCDLLIIDDLGVEPSSAYVTAIFSDVLDKRVMRGKKMVISTNTRVNDLKNIYGQRVYSRIHGYFDCYLFYGDDIRIKRGKNQ